MQLYIALILFLMSSSIQAEIYKWTDAQGNIHYSQTAPTNTTSTKIAAPPPPAISPEEATATLNDKIEKNEMSNLEQAIKDQNASNLKKKQARYKKNCDIAQKNHTLYTAHSRVRKQESDGSYTALTEEQRQQRIVDIKKNMTQYCDTPVTLSEEETAKIIINEVELDSKN